MKEYAARFWRDESGEDIVEYALLLAALAVVVVASMATVATTVSTVWTNTDTQLSAS